jgi:hypothetical protein
MNLSLHGISAASGKAGAIVAAFGFLYATSHELLLCTRSAYGEKSMQRRTLLFFVESFKLLQTLPTIPLWSVNLLKQELQTLK